MYISDIDLEYDDKTGRNFQYQISPRKIILLRVYMYIYNKQTLLYTRQGPNGRDYNEVFLFIEPCEQHTRELRDGDNSESSIFH